MNRSSFISLLSLVAVACGTTNAFAGFDSYTMIADGKDFNGGSKPFYRFYGSPVLNNNGGVAFQGVNGDGNNGFHVTTDSGATYATVASSATYQYFDFLNNAIAINDSGTVAYYAGAAYRTYSNGTQSLVANASTAGFAGRRFDRNKININNAGQVAFGVVNENTGARELWLKSGSNFVNKFSNQTGAITTPTLNNNGQIATTFANFQAYAARRINADGSFTDIGSNVSTNTDFDQMNTDINDAGQMLFTDRAGSLYGFDGANTSLLVSVGQTLSPGNFVQNISNFSLNNGGQVVFGAIWQNRFYGDSGDQYQHGLYFKDAQGVHAIIEAGQVFSGRTVLGVNIGDQGLNNNGDIAFNIRFTNNTQAVVRGRVTGLGVVVPEANTFVLALPALGMVGAVVLRRRKK